MRRRVPEIVASEGYFSPTVDIKYDDEKREHATVVVTLGTRTTVSSVEIEFAGDLAGQGPLLEKRRQELRDSWALKRGEPFRSPDWESAKVKLEEDLTALDYATGRLTASRGEVDAEAATAKLSLTLDSGPPFTMGEVDRGRVDASDRRSRYSASWTSSAGSDTAVAPTGRHAAAGSRTAGGFPASSWIRSAIPRNRRKSR